MPSSPHPAQPGLFDESPATPRQSTTLYERITAAIQGSTNPYARKDAQKALTANKFIGQGSRPSSTHKYRIAAGTAANCGQYEASDVVFVSAEGARYGRLDIDREELSRAAHAKVTFITDTPPDRQRAYNVGERDVAAFLQSVGYLEAYPGQWRAGQP